MATSVSRVNMVPLWRRDGNKHSIGNSVGVFQLIERDNVWVILFEMIPNVDIDRYQVLGTRGEGQYDKQRE